MTRATGCTAWSDGVHQGMCGGAVRARPAGSGRPRTRPACPGTCYSSVVGLVGDQLADLAVHPRLVVRVVADRDPHHDRHVELQQALLHEALRVLVALPHRRAERAEREGLDAHQPAGQLQLGDHPVQAVDRLPDVLEDHDRVVGAQRVRRAGQGGQHRQVAPDERPPHRAPRAGHMVHLCTEAGALLEQRAHPFEDGGRCEVTQGGDHRRVDPHEPVRDRMGEIVGQAVLAIERGQEGRGVREAEERAIGARPQGRGSAGSGPRAGASHRSHRERTRSPRPRGRSSPSAGRRAAAGLVPAVCPATARTCLPTSGRYPHPCSTSRPRPRRAGWTGPEGAMTAMRAPGASSGPGRSGWLSNISTADPPPRWWVRGDDPTLRQQRGCSAVGRAKPGGGGQRPGDGEGAASRLPLRRGGGYGI